MESGSSGCVGGLAIPRYDFTCEDNHTFELVAGVDEEETWCRVPIPARSNTMGLTGTQACCKPSKRHAIYLSQGIIFKGEGFTKSVRVPEPPEPPETGSLPVHGHLEELDNFARTSHAYNENVRPERKKERKKKENG